MRVEQDEPTTSILDPAPGYANGFCALHQSLSADFDKYARCVAVLACHHPCSLRSLLGSRSPAGDITKRYLDTNSKQLPDPFQLVHKDIVTMTDSIKHILDSDHPVLSAVAKYFFEHDGGKKVRPTMVLLVAQAAEAHRAAVGNPLPETQSVEFTAAAQKRLAEIVYVRLVPMSSGWSF